jgi:hypothetical protein
MDIFIFIVYLLDLLIVRIIWRLSYEIGVPTIRPQRSVTWLKHDFQITLPFRFLAVPLQMLDPEMNCASFNQLPYLLITITLISLVQRQCSTHAFWMYLVRISSDFCVSVLRGFPKFMQDSTVKYATIASLRIRIYASFIHKLNL